MTAARLILLTLSMALMAPAAAQQAFPLRASGMRNVAYYERALPEVPYAVFDTLMAVAYIVDGLPAAVSDLKKQAKAKHYDALIEVERMMEAMPVTKCEPDGYGFEICRPTGEYEYSKEVMLVRAVGIKYASNMLYINELPAKEELFVPVEGGADALVAAVQYAPNGAVSDTAFFRSNKGRELFSGVLFPYGDYHLMEEQQGWKSSNNLDGLVSRRELSRKGWLLKMCRFSYKSGRLHRISIAYGMPGAGEALSLDYVRYIYGENGQISQRVIEQHGGRTIEERHIRDAQGKLLRREFWEKGKKMPERLLFYTSVACYKQEDLAKWVTMKVPKA